MEEGRGCGAVSRPVAPDIRGPWFESQHRQSFSKIFDHICKLQFRKDKNKEKEARIGPFKKMCIEEE